LNVVMRELFNWVHKSNDSRSVRVCQ
jgi:hypothetical protein